jgi:hypothetical protein
MPIIRRQIDVQLPGPHTQHVTLLHAIRLAAYEERWQEDEHQVEAACGAGGAAHRIAETLDPEGYVVLTPDQRSVVPNPALFKPLPTEGLTEFQTLLYEASLNTSRWHMDRLYPGR